MSLVTESPTPPAVTFSPRTILAIVLVGVLSFSGLAVLATYAPDLRGANDPGPHALSRSAVGFAGAVAMLRALDTPVVVSRTPPGVEGKVLLVLTPGPGTGQDDLAEIPPERRKLIVLPKWQAAPDPVRPGYVQKAGLIGNEVSAGSLLAAYAPGAKLARRKGASRPVLTGAGGMFAQARLPLGAIDSLQTLAGEGWVPLLTDEAGLTVLAQSHAKPHVYVLADPDLLNTQGLRQPANARAGVAIVDGLRQGQGVVFDVTLNGFERGRGLWRTLLEPPWLAATLCAVAAAVLMGLHGLARFGPARASGRAFALGQEVLVDNSAALVRMARKEQEFAPAYAALIKGLIRRAAGGERDRAGDDGEAWLEDVARLRQAASPAELSQAAQAVRTRDDLLAVARRLHEWRLEMTRERR